MEHEDIVDMDVPMENARANVDNVYSAAMQRHAEFGQSFGAGQTESETALINKAIEDSLK